jgi:hypothetical protein
MTKLMAGLVSMVAVVPALGRADQSEWRIGAGGGAIVVDARAGGADGIGIGYEARARLGYGLSNVLELGLVGGYAHASDVEVDGAAVGGQAGTLYADVSALGLGVEARWTPGLGLARAFERTSPYLAVRAGAALALRANQQLFTPSDQLIVQPSDDVEVGAWVGGSIGIEHRFGDRVFLAVEIMAAVVGEANVLGLSAEGAWAWY